MDKPSKTERKNEALFRQDLGEKLVGLTGDQIRKINLPEHLFEAVMQAKKITKRGGLKRQMQYIGALMRKTDPKPIQETIQNLEEGNRKQAAVHRQIEKWRDELAAGNKTLIEELLIRFPDADRGELAALAEKAERDHTAGTDSRASSRALFRYLFMLCERRDRGIPEEHPKEGESRDTSDGLS